MKQKSFNFSSEIKYLGVNKMVQGKITYHKMQRSCGHSFK